jgi:hypothetical protein
MPGVLFKIFLLNMVNDNFAKASDLGEGVYLSYYYFSFFTTKIVNVKFLLLTGETNNEAE